MVGALAPYISSSDMSGFNEPQVNRMPQTVLGDVHKECPIFFAIMEIPTYLCPIHYVLSIYVLCPIFLDIPT